jgi:hypothetical protein
MKHADRDASEVDKFSPPLGNFANARDDMPDH